MSATDSLRELAEKSLLSSREFDGLGFIDRLLQLSTEIGQIRATLAGESVIRFEVSGNAACDVPVERAKSKLRMLCARLAVLCHESGDAELMLYGGEGTIRERALTPSVASESNGPSRSLAATRAIARTWFVRLKNTTDEQEFTITPN